jgi:uncharacterized protein (TIGR00369 family)
MPETADQGIADARVPTQKPTGPAAPPEFLVRDVLRLIQDGSIPPPGAAATLGLRIVDLGQDWASFELTPGPEHLNADGSVNGGVLAVLADFALCCALNDTPAMDALSTAGLNIIFQQPVTLETGTVTALAQVLHRTNRTATVEARIIDADTRLYALATATVLVRPQPQP